MFRDTRGVVKCDRRFFRNIPLRRNTTMIFHQKHIDSSYLSDRSCPLGFLPNTFVPIHEEFLGSRSYFHSNYRVYATKYWFYQKPVHPYSISWNVASKGFQTCQSKNTVHRAIRHLSPFYWPFYAGLRFHTTKANKYLSWRNTWHDYFPWYVSFAQKAALKALTAIFQRPVARQKYK